jgi:hypothetical protein
MAFKRNLFGEQTEEEQVGFPILAKQLMASPVPSSCSFLIDPAIQSIKCNDFSYKVQSSEKEVKGIAYGLDFIFIKSLLKLC